MTEIKVKKYLFTLKNIDREKIHKQYNIDIDLNNNVTKTTKLSELNMDKGNPDVISFLDESKRIHQCHISMIDFHTGMKVSCLKYNCYWCRNKFDNIPIGCPIKYISNQAIKTYNSHISKDTYTIKENITVSKTEDISENEQLKVKEYDYYETDGIFCSFNCCKSWINDNKHIRMYDYSNLLLIKMYNTLINTTISKINPAPHWRLLEEYGGHLNIIKFRENFNKIEYEYQGNTKNIPKFVSVGILFEEKIKF